MKRLKNILKYTILVALIIILCRGFLYRSLVKYNKINVRKSIVLTNLNLTNEINTLIKDKILNIEDVVNLSNKITSEKLKFTFNKAPSNPNHVFIEKKAHCVGYASLFNAIGNHILKQQKMTEHYEFIHMVGKLTVLGYDIHHVFDSPFFKDHDFNAIRNKTSGKTIFTDPSVRDYLWIERVRLNSL